MPRTPHPGHRCVAGDACEQLNALSTALDALAENQRRTWLLREVADLSYQEIADEMDLPVSTVRGNLARARTSIMIRMEEWR